MIMSEQIMVSRPECLIEKQKIIDSYIDSFLPPEDQYPSSLHTAIRYSVMVGGKRLRPILALASYEAFGGSEEVILPAAVALEFIHSYSLIHDDLPCMDDDDLRRGRPTLHKEYNEGIALLAGDALHDLAFKLMARTGDTRVVTELADAIGTRGMLAGQIADMEAEGRPLTLDEISFVHEHKTGKLFRCSVRIGAILAGATSGDLACITEYGEKIGLAFQIVDDILDIEGSTELLGKPVGSDTKNDKATFPGVVGVSESKQIATKLIDDAISAIVSIKGQTQDLIELAHFINWRQS